MNDQYVQVGYPLIYQLGLPSNIYGYYMEVEMFLGDAFRFATFDENLNLFKVHADLTVREDIGVYPIQVKARLFSAKFDETYVATFMLTVWDDPLPEEEPWFPPDPISYDEWEGPIIRQER